MTTRISAEARGRKTVKMKNTRGSAQLPSICQPSHAAMRKVAQVLAPCAHVFCWYRALHAEHFSLPWRERSRL